MLSELAARSKSLRITDQAIDVVVTFSGTIKGEMSFDRSLSFAILGYVEFVIFKVNDESVL